MTKADPKKPPLRVIRPGDAVSALAPPPDGPRDMYVYMGVTVSEIARRYAGVRGCSRDRLQARKTKENWDGLRHKAAAEAQQQTDRKVGETRADMVARHMKTARALETLGGTLENIITRAIVKMQVKDEAGNVIGYRSAIYSPTGQIVGYTDLDAEQIVKISSAHRNASSTVIEAIRLQGSLVGEKEDRVSELFRSAQELFDEAARAMDETATSAHRAVEEEAEDSGSQTS